MGVKQSSQAYTGCSRWRVRPPLRLVYVPSQVSHIFSLTWVYDVDLWS